MSKNASETSKTSPILRTNIFVGPVICQKMLINLLGQPRRLERNFGGKI